MGRRTFRAFTFASCWLGGLIGLTGAACSLGDFSQYSGDPEADGGPGASDAPSGPDGGGGAEGGTTPGDGGGAPDGNGNGGGNDGGGDAAPARFCPRAGATWCSDFDDPSPSAALPGPWDPLQIPPGDTLAVSSTQVFSGTRSLLVAATPDQPGVSLFKKVDQVAGFNLDFQVYIQDRGPNLYVATFTSDTSRLIGITPRDETYSSLTESFPVEGGYAYPGVTLGPIPIHQWTHLVLDVDFVTAKASLTADGIGTVSYTLAGAWGTRVDGFMNIGIPDSPASSFYADDIAVTIR